MISLRAERPSNLKMVVHLTAARRFFSCFLFLETKIDKNLDGLFAWHTRVSRCDSISQEDIERQKRSYKRIYKIVLLLYHFFFTWILLST